MVYLRKNPESVALRIKDATALQRLEMHPSG